MKNVHKGVPFLSIFLRYIAPFFNKSSENGNSGPQKSTRITKINEYHFKKNIFQA
jgi:hypothetical protein